MLICRTKSSSVMSLIFFLIASLIVKCIHNVSLFGADFGLEESSDHSSSKKKNTAGQAITVNGARYRGMIILFFVPKLQEMDVDDMWFHRDDAIQPEK